MVADGNRRHSHHPLPGATDLKPGSATRPFFGIRPELVDNEGAVVEGAVDGNLCIIDSWPGQMRTLYGDHKRFIEAYFSTYKGKYFTGDGCRRDEDGYYWITGRVDDVLNISGHRPARRKSNRHSSRITRFQKPLSWAIRIRSRDKASIATSR